MILRHVKKWLKGLRRKKALEARRIPKGLNPKKEAARRRHVENVRKHQSEGREFAYMRKAIRAAEKGGAYEKQHLATLKKARGFR